MYHVKSLQYPWFGGEGFIQGRSVVRIHIGQSSNSKRLSAHQLGQRIVSMIPGMDRTALWVAITGETEQADNMLKLVLGSAIGKLTYIESHGAKSMCDSTGHLPIWDHVCLRTTVPANPAGIQIFHSVIVEGTPSIEEIKEFEFNLGKISYNGPRYIKNTPHGRRIVKNFAQTYTLTQPIGIAPCN